MRTAYVAVGVGLIIGSFLLAPLWAKALIVGVVLLVDNEKL